MKIELQTLIGSLDSNCKKYIENAAQRSISRNGTEILIEDMFYVMLDVDDSILNKLLKQYKLDSQIMKEVLEKSFQTATQSESVNPVFSYQLIDIIENAYLQSKIEFNLTHIKEETLFYSFFKNSTKYSNTSYFKIFEKIDINELLGLLMGLINNDEKLNSKKNSNSESNKNDELEKYTLNLTKLAEDGKIDPVLSRDNEIKQVIDILSRRRKNNPILVGEAGVGKTAVVEGLALKIVNKEVPKHLYNAQILSLDLGAMQSGASIKGEFERRLQFIINEIKSSTQFTILFIDEAHTLIGAGGNEGGGDAANLLKPALARGELKTIAATTWLEYRKYFEKDPALARRFQKIDLLEPSVDECITILRGIVNKYEEVHNVYIEDDALIAAATLSARYITGRQLPDKAIDVLDTACANVRISASNKPYGIQRLEVDLEVSHQKFNALSRDHENLIKDNSVELEELSIYIDEIKSKISREVILWQEQKEMLDLIKELKKYGDKEAVKEAYKKFKKVQESKKYLHENVSSEQIAEVISAWTGVPLGSMKKEQAKLVNNFSTNMKNSIIGQDAAIDYLNQFLQISIAGLKKESTPQGIFLLVGPSGVGKTETALIMADLLFGGKSFITIINMSEFQEKHTVSRLIGSPPGYVGYGEGGQLTDPIRVKPYSVVLLDEVEKAHPDILNLFYQIFDKGIVNDGEGREIDFKNTVIIMTSNLATEEITQLFLNNIDIDIEYITEQITPLLSQYFKPALLGRMNVIPYKNLSFGALKKITSLKLKIIKKQLETKGIELIMDDKLIDHIVDLAESTDTGARNLELIINNNIMPKLAKVILNATVENKVLKSIIVMLDSDKSIKLNVVAKDL